MPIRQGRDAKGTFYQFGNHGKKYYYVPGNKMSKDTAKLKARRQAIAVYSSITISDYRE